MIKLKSVHTPTADAVCRSQVDMFSWVHLINHTGGINAHIATACKRVKLLVRNSRLINPASSNKGLHQGVRRIDIFRPRCYDRIRIEGTRTLT